MALERGWKTLLSNVCSLIAEGGVNTYLCCILLQNLCYNEKAAKLLFSYSPRPEEQKKLKNVLQKVRRIEDFILFDTNTPTNTNSNRQNLPLTLAAFLVVCPNILCRGYHH